MVFSKNITSSLKTELLAHLQMVEVEYHAKYLGLPTILGRSKKAIFASIKERVRKKLQRFKGKFLSSVGKEVLPKAVAQAIPTYAISIFKLPDTLFGKIHATFAKF